MAKKLGLPEPGQRRALTQGEAVTMRAGAGDWEVGCTREGECYVWRDGCPHEERVDEAYIELLEEYWGDQSEGGREISAIPHRCRHNWTPR